MNNEDISIKEALRQNQDRNESRFDKIENKLDLMSKVLVTLAKIDTRVNALENSRLEQGRRLGDLEKHAYKAEEETRLNTEFRSVILKAFWILLSAVVTIGVGLYLNGTLSIS